MIIKSRTSLFGAVLASIAVVLLSVCSAMGAEKKAPGPVNYPHAGISVTLPEGFETHTTALPSIVVRAGMKVAGKPAVAVTVSAFCVATKAKASEFADFSDNALKSQLSVRKFKALKSVPIKVAGIEGVARLLKYTYDGAMTTAARVFVVRELDGWDFALCYMLTVEAGAKREARLLPTLNKVISGITLTKPQAPASIPIRLSDRKLTDYRGGFTLRLPESWYGSPIKGGVSLGLKNYVARGVDSPQVVVLSASVPPEASAEAMATKAASRYIAATTQPDSGIELLGKGPAKVGKQDAYQYILKIMYDVPAEEKTGDKAKSAKPAKPAKIGKIQALRIVCRKDSDGKSVRAYFFTLSCLESEAKQVTPVFDALAGGFEYIPMPEPAKKPAPK